MTDTSSSATASPPIHETRDERRHLRLELPFRVAFDEASTLPGHDLSLSGFSLYILNSSNKCSTCGIQGS
ncbi:hypothetical protein [Halomonas saccharevitans]|uniref:PilZ domain-containing protein n=1 Tax=Halomonas saccharevitans TaxID=416872 RepID=A0A1I7C3L5_9GAMM|nr:hypothetical protein [Halomonas saccharevitans]SFT93974.1 hypothetical protein SAMN04487956_13433 [Halomonas saccharevitans]